MCYSSVTLQKRQVKEGETTMKKILFALWLCLLSLEAWAEGVPVFMLIQPEGQVEFSRDGEKWSPLTRNKLLFAGDFVKTGANGSSKVIHQANGKGQNLAANSQIKVEETGAKLLSGNLSAPEEVAGDLLAGLGNRFTVAQRYTTVRRSAGGKEDEAPKLRAAKELKLSPSYPDLVWENLGEKYSHVLEIAGQNIKIPSTKGDFVRVSLKDLKPGKYPFVVHVLEGDKEVTASEKESSLTFLAEAEDKALKADEAKLRSLIKDDDFFLGNFFDARGLLVAAMDHYRRHFIAHKDDNEARPLLIKVYNDLRLGTLRKKEAVLYNEAAN